MISSIFCGYKACYKYGHDHKRRHANQKFTNKQEKNKFAKDIKVEKVAEILQKILILILRQLEIS